MPAPAGRRPRSGGILAGGTPTGTAGYGTRTASPRWPRTPAMARRRADELDRGRDTPDRTAAKLPSAALAGQTSPLLRRCLPAPQ
jgi:hypothetical protein